MSCTTGCFTIDCSCPLSFLRRCSSRNSNRKIVLMLVGLDNAGKSSIASRLANEPVEGVVPTVGFNAITLRHRGVPVIIYDLGGSAQIRGIWHRYFADVHGVIFVVDASDTSRIDESRKVLEELLANDLLAGKPLLMLANKQDRNGALDDIDVVERLNVETLVNLQRCPTLVETCTASGPPGGHRPRLDSGIDKGYKWLVRRILSDYEALNGRVERDTAEQRAANEAARQEWLKRQDTEQQVDSLPSEYEENPFKPIHTVVEPKQNGHVMNGHSVRLEPLSLSISLSEDSPDSSSHTVGGESEGGVYIPLHSPVHSPPPPAEPDVLVISQPQPADVVMAVKQQFEWKMQKQKRKLLLLRSNRTAPTSASSEEGDKVLPPLRTPHSCSWARPGSAKSLPSQGWGLGLSLEEVNSPVEDVGHIVIKSPNLQVIKSPKRLTISDDDDDDVVVGIS